jgi:hypothetical protein
MDTNKVRSIVGNVVPTHTLPGWDAAYGLVYPSILLAEGYKYVMHVDHDAFPSVNLLNEIYKFLEANPQVDFLSPTNCLRCVNAHGPSVTMELFSEKKEINGRMFHSFFPFDYPSDNGDLLVIKRDLFFSARKEMIPTFGPSVNPINKFSLNYGQICDILGARDPRITSQARASQFIMDGAFQGDIWTWICAQKPVMAGVVSNEGISFQRKNRLRDACLLWPNLTWGRIKDDSDVSYPHKLNVCNDELFHLEAGYMIWGYWTPRLGSDLDAFAGMESAFRSPPGNFWTQHFAAVHLLTKHCEIPDLITGLDANAARLLAHFGQDPKPFWEVVERIEQYCKEPLKEYLS